MSTNMVYCEMCENMVWKDAAHSCHDAKALRRVRDAERDVIAKATALVSLADDTGVDMDDDLFAASWGFFSDAVRALNAATGATP